MTIFRRMFLVSRTGIRSALRTVFCLLAAIGMPASALARQAPTLTNVGVALPRVYVVDAEGRKLEGQLISITAEEVRVRTATGPQSIPANRVAKLQWQGDSLKNGAIIGAFAGAMLAATQSCEETALDRTSCAGERTEMTIASALWGAAVGSGFDAMVSGRTTLWRQRSASTHEPAGGLGERGLPAFVVIATDRVGRETAGALVQLTESGLQLDTGHEIRRVAVADLWRLERRGDSVRNGTLTGAWIGAGLGVLISTAGRLGACDGDCYVPVASILIASTALGASAGLALDAAHTGRTPLWIAEPGMPRVTFGVETTPSRFAIRARVRW